MKKNIKLFLKLAISGIILSFLFYKIPIYEIVKSLENADIFLIILSILIYILIVYLSAFETGYLTRAMGIIISTFQILKIQMATRFYGLFLPGTLSGGAIKWYKLSKYGSKSDAAAVVVFNRFLEILMLFYTGIIFSLPALIKAKQNQLILIWLFIFLIIIVSYFLLLNSRFLTFFERKILFIPFPELIKNIIPKLFNSIQKFQKLTLKDNFQIFGLLFFYHFLGIIAAYLLALSLGIDITFFDIAWIGSVIGILAILPISFAGLGVREGSLVFLLGNYGIPAGDAMAYSFLLFFYTVLVSLSGGFIELSDFIKGKKVKANYETESTD